MIKKTNLSIQHLEEISILNLSRINVVGRVNQPGTYNLTSLSTLNDAIDIAGGAKALRGQIRYLTINNDGTFEKRAVNYRAKQKRLI